MTADLDPILTVAEVAMFAKVCTKTVYRAIGSGALEAGTVGRGYRIDRESVFAWLAAPSRETTSRGSTRIRAGRSRSASPTRLRAIEEGRA